MPAFSFTDFSLPLAGAAALLLDRLLGEPARWHPLVGFGHWAARLERALNRTHNRTHGHASRSLGLLAWGLAVLPLVLLALWLRTVSTLAPFLVDTLLLYFAVGARSLCQHAARVADDLAAGNLAAAREHVGWIVSRDTSALDEQGVAKAAIESTLENGNDAVFGALFWFALLGGPGALLFRLANTLDAMWGYKTPRFLRFGWTAARVDDALNYLPARLTALTYALLGRTATALACWRTQAPQWESPNAGPVMAAGAGALALTLGGAAVYHGQLEQRPPLGQGTAPQAADIGRAVRLVQRGVLLWLAVMAVMAMIVLLGALDHA